MQPDQQPLGVSSASICGPVSRAFAHNPVPGKIILEDNRVHQKHSVGTFRFGKKSPQRSLTSLCFKRGPERSRHQVPRVWRSKQERGRDGAACRQAELQLLLLLPAAPGPFLRALFSEQT